MTTNFYLGKRRDENGKPKTGRKGQLPVYLYIYLDRKNRFKIYTNERIDPKFWDYDMQRMIKKATGATEFNNLLDTMEEEIKKINREARIQGKNVTIEYLRSMLTFARKKEKEFDYYWNKFTEAEARRWSEGTMKNFKTFKKNLDKFSEEKSFDLSFDNLGQTFIDEYIKWRADKGTRNTHTLKDIKLMKWFLSWATGKGYNRNLHFQSKEWSTKRLGLTVPKSNDNVWPLTLEERNTLLNLDIDDPVLDKVRDIFIFGCFTGLRYSDLEKVKKDDIDGEFLRVTTVKTTDPALFYLVPPALDIINKYRDLPGDLALPVKVIQKYNENLKDLGKLAGFTRKVKEIYFIRKKRYDKYYAMWEKLSSHIARKTKETIDSECGVASYVTSLTTGHETEQMKDRYRGMSPEHIKEEQMKIWKPEMKIVS